jgi:hypothetical protein
MLLHVGIFTRRRRKSKPSKEDKKFSDRMRFDQHMIWDWNQYPNGELVSGMGSSLGRERHATSDNRRFKESRD